MRSPERSGVALRVRLAAVPLALAFLVLAGRAAQLTLIDPRGATRGDSQATTVLRVAAARGALFDRDGRPLAVTVPVPSVFAEPRRIENPRAAARALAKALGLEAGALEKRLGRRSAFVYLARWVSDEQAAAVSALDLRGVGLVEEPRRAYPLGAFAGPVIGFSNIDGHGVRGIEQQEDTWLRGQSRRLAAERDARRRLLASRGVDPRSAAGGDVALTLDAAFQADAEAALAEAVEATGARGGTVISLDPRTGEVLALAEWPGFDPNHFRRVPYGKTRSRSLLDAIEPGSTLKPFLVAGALEANVLARDDVIDLEGGRLRVSGKTFRDPHPHDSLDVTSVLRVSSNVGSAKIGFRLGARSHFDTLRRFGFGAPTGSGFPEESAGLLRRPGRWRPLDHATISFGQGLSSTPLQLAAAYAALADDGRWRTPRLVFARRVAGGAWQPTVPAEARAAVSPEVAQTVLAMLEEAAGPRGTGRRAGLRGVRVAGKTGTSQKLDPETGAYSTDRYLAWFAGIVPADDPRLVIVAVVDEPVGDPHTGGAVAAPVFARVAAAQLARLGVATAPALPAVRMARSQHDTPDESDPEIVAVAEATGAAAGTPTTATTAVEAPKARGDVAAPPPPAPGSAVPAVLEAGLAITRLGDRLLLPDFRGLSPEDVVRLTRGLSLEVEMQGKGRAVSQEPAPGTVVALRGARLQLRFEPATDAGEEG